MNCDCIEWRGDLEGMCTRSNSHMRALAVLDLYDIVEILIPQFRCFVEIEVCVADMIVVLVIGKRNPDQLLGVDFLQ